MSWKKVIKAPAIYTGDDYEYEKKEMERRLSLVKRLRQRVTENKEFLEKFVFDKAMRHLDAMEGEAGGGSAFNRHLVAVSDIIKSLKV